MTDLALAYAELKTGKKNYPLKFIGIRAGEKIDEILVSEEEMRHSVEKKNHFVINREAKIDKLSTKNIISHEQYGSSNTKHLSIYQLKEMMKKLQWVI